MHRNDMPYPPYPWCWRSWAQKFLEAKLNLSYSSSRRKAKGEKYCMFFDGVQHDQRSKPKNNCHGRCLLAENRHQFRLVVYLVYSAEMSLSGLLDYHQGGMSWLVPGHFGRGSLDMIPLEPSHPRYCWRSRKGSIHLAQPASNNTSSHHTRRT